MSEINKWVDLKTVVSYAIDEMDKNYADFDKAWILGLRALVEMNFDVSAEPKTVRIPMNGNKTATIPSDCISWSKIGILDNRGSISTLKINNALTTWMDNSPDRIQKIGMSQVNDSVGALVGAAQYLNYYYQGNYVNLFGVGGGLIQYGECRVDDKNNIIIMPENFQHDSILLEYISSPERDGDYKVELRFQEAVIAFIKWKMKQGAREEYYAAVTAGRRRGGKKKVTLQTINQVLRMDTGMHLLT